MCGSDKFDMRFRQIEKKQTRQATIFDSQKSLIVAAHACGLQLVEPARRLDPIGHHVGHPLVQPRHQIERVGTSQAERVHRDAVRAFIELCTASTVGGTLHGERGEHRTQARQTMCGPDRTVFRLPALENNAVLESAARP